MWTKSQVIAYNGIKFLDFGKLILGIFENISNHWSV